MATTFEIAQEVVKDYDGSFRVKTTEVRTSRMIEDGSPPPRDRGQDDMLVSREISHRVVHDPVRDTRTGRVIGPNDKVVEERVTKETRVAYSYD